MKIAHFSDSFLPKVDGVAFSLEELSKRQAERDEVRLFVPAFGKRERRQKRGGVMIESYSSVPAPTYKDVHLALPNFLKILKVVREFDPDVIHVHTPAMMGLVGVILARRLGKPVVGTYHTLISEILMYLVPKWSWGGEIKLKVGSVWKELVGEGGGNGFVGGFVGELKTVFEIGRPSEKKEAVLKRITWFLVNKFFNYCDVVIAPSGIIRSELLKRGLKKEVVVVSNGIDTQVFKPKMRYVQEFKVLHVGRMGFEKRVEDVIDAFCEVVKKVPQARLTLVGDGPARVGLEKRIRHLGLQEVAKFVGWVDRTNLGEVYASHNAFVTASPMETQGLVILEAMACGVPVVGVDKFAVSDIVVTGKNGFLVKAGDVKKMAGRIGEIILDVRLEKELGEGARKTAEGHDIRKTVEKIEAIYKKVSAQKRLANGLEAGAGFT